MRRLYKTKSKNDVFDVKNNQSSKLLLKNNWAEITKNRNMKYDVNRFWTNNINLFVKKHKHAKDHITTNNWPYCWKYTIGSFYDSSGKVLSLFGKG